MQPPDQFGGLDVGRVLVPERPALHPEDEAERLDMARQFRERERDGLPLVKIVQLECLEVAYQNVAGMVTLGQCEQIVDRLAVGFLQVAPGALLLDDQHTRPELVRDVFPLFGEGGSAGANLVP